VISSTGFSGVQRPILGYSSYRVVKTSGIQMGFFDAIGKALQESMANDESLGAKQNPGFRVNLVMNTCSKNF
jgi:hypothetical protein